MTLAQMAALHAACFTTPRPWTGDELASLLQSPLVFALSESAGFVLGRAVAGEAELLTLAVDPARRRQGIGASLVGRFLQEARARQAQTAFLEVSADNSAAIALYHRAGFAQTGRRRGYYVAPDGTRSDALILSRAC